MKKILTSLTLFSALCAFSLEGSIMSQLNANNDHGIWFEQMATLHLQREWSVKLKTEQRLGADYKKFWDYEFEAVFQYDLLHLLPCSRLNLTTLSIGPGYNATKQFQKNTNSIYHWVWINRTILQAFISFDFYNWSIRQRLYGEYYDYTKKHYKDYGLYRHRLAIYTPWKFTCLKINPFVSNEWFFRNNTYSSSHTSGLVGPYYENRFRVGLEASFTENFDSFAGWQWRTTKQKPGSHPGWFNTYQYVINISLKY